MWDKLDKRFAIVVAAITFGSYFCAYAFQVGVFSFYRLPLSLILISIGDLALPGIILSAMISSSMLLYFKWQFARQIKGHITFKTCFLISGIALELLISAGLLGVINFSNGYVLIPIALLISFFVELISLKFTRIFDYQIAEGLILPQDDTANLKKATSKQLFLNGSLLLLGTALVFFLYGFIYTFQKKNYSVISNHKSLLIIGQNGENFICKTYDSKKKIWTDTVKFVKVEGTTILTTKTQRH